MEDRVIFCVLQFISSSVGNAFYLIRWNRFSVYLRKYSILTIDAISSHGVFTFASPVPVFGVRLNYVTFKILIFKVLKFKSLLSSNKYRIYIECWITYR